MTSGLRVRWLLALAVVAAGVGWGVLTLVERGGVVGRIAWPVPVTLVLLAGLVVWAGWAVRQYTKGRRPSLTGLRAARTLVLAQSAALTGAALGGWYVAHVLLVVGDLDVAALRSKALSAGLAALAAAALAVAGVVVETWCKVRGGEDDGSSERGATATPA